MSQTQLSFLNSWARLLAGGGSATGVTPFSIGAIEQYPLITLLSFLVIIAFILMFDFMTKFLEFILEDSPRYNRMVQNIYKELMQMGIISFCFVIFASSAHSNPWVAALDFAHILLFFVAIFFVVHTFYLITVSMSASNLYSRLNAVNSYELITGKSQLSWFQEFRFNLIFLPFSSMREKFEFKLLHILFRETFTKLPENFSFNLYLSKSFEQYSLMIMDFGVLSWAVVFLLVLANFIRISVNGETDCYYHPEECAVTITRILGVLAVLLVIYCGLVLFIGRIYEVRLIHYAGVKSPIEYEDFLNFVVKEEKLMKQQNDMRGLEKDCLTTEELKILVDEFVDAKENNEENQIYRQICNTWSQFTNYTTDIGYSFTVWYRIRMRRKIGPGTNETTMKVPSLLNKKEDSQHDEQFQNMKKQSKMNKEQQQQQQSKEQHMEEGVYTNENEYDNNNNNGATTSGGDVNATSAATTTSAHNKARNKLQTTLQAPAKRRLSVANNNSDVASSIILAMKIEKEQADLERSILLKSPRNNTNNRSNTSNTVRKLTQISTRIKNTLSTAVSSKPPISTIANATGGSGGTDTMNSTENDANGVTSTTPLTPAATTAALAQHQSSIPSPFPFPPRSPRSHKPPKRSFRQGGGGGGVNDKFQDAIRGNTTNATMNTLIYANNGTSIAGINNIGTIAEEKDERSGSRIDNNSISYHSNISNRNNANTNTSNNANSTNTSAAVVIPTLLLQSIEDESPRNQHASITSNTNTHSVLPHNSHNNGDNNNHINITSTLSNGNNSQSTKPQPHQIPTSHATPNEHSILNNHSHPHHLIHVQHSQNLNTTTTNANNNNNSNDNDNDNAINSLNSSVTANTLAIARSRKASVASEKSTHSTKSVSRRVSIGGGNSTIKVIDEIRASMMKRRNSSRYSLVGNSVSSKNKDNHNNNNNDITNNTNNDNKSSKSNKDGLHNQLESTHIESIFEKYIQHRKREQCIYDDDDNHHSRRHSINTHTFLPKFLKSNKNSNGTTAATHTTGGSGGSGTGNDADTESSTVEDRGDFDEIFFLQNPIYFFRAVEVALMLNSFFLALGTYYIEPLLPYVYLGWPLILALPVVITFPFIGRIVKVASLIKAVTELQLEVIRDVLTESEDMEILTEELRSTILSKIEAFHKKIVAPTTTKKAQNAATALKQEIIHRLFKEIDVDGNDVVDKVEFRNLLNMLQLQYSDKRFKRLFKAVDVKSKGKIGIAELEALLFPIEANNNGKRLSQTTDREKDEK